MTEKDIVLKEIPTSYYEYNRSANIITTIYKTMVYKLIKLYDFYLPKTNSVHKINHCNSIIQ